jgi:hypothetical protein
MNWLKYKLRDWLLSNEAEVSAKLSRRHNSITIDNDSLDSDKAIRFAAYKASGGMVVETNFYDRIKDRTYRSLHIITDDKDLGKEIGRIITMETLKV